MTNYQYAISIGANWNSAKSALNRSKLPVGKHTPAGDDARAVIDSVLRSGAPETENTPVSTPRKPKPETVHTKPAKPDAKPETKTGKTIDIKTVILWVLVLVPTVASGNNIVRVCLSIMGEPVGGWSMAAVIFGTAMALTYVGGQTRLTKWVVAAVLMFETFANTAVIYDGLMGGLNNPTRFLGTVVNIFGTGTHYTAIFLAAFAALLLVGTQFASLSQLKK